MPDNLAIKDGNTAARSIATKDVGGVHHPKHMIAGPDGVVQDLLAALNDQAPASDLVAVTPSDATNLTGVRGLYVGTGGSLVLTINSHDVNLANVADGFLLPAKGITKVKATGTTATGIVALK